jgi:hypothetical protein
VYLPIFVSGPWPERRSLGEMDPQPGRLGASQAVPASPQKFS